MKFVTAKAAQLVLDGITIDTEHRNDQLHSVTLRDAAGHLVKIANETFSMNAYIPAPPKMVDKYRLSGKPAGIPVEHFFDDEYKALEKKHEYERAVSDVDAAEMAIEKVQVAETE